MAKGEGLYGVWIVREMLNEVKGWRSQLSICAPWSVVRGLLSVVCCPWSVVWWLTSLEPSRQLYSFFLSNRRVLWCPLEDYKFTSIEVCISSLGGC